MSGMMKASLVVLAVIAGATVGNAADGRDGRDSRDRGMDSRGNAPDLWEREKQIDPDTTGSIRNCDSGAFDEFGNCIPDAATDMQ